VVIQHRQSNWPKNHQIKADLRKNKPISMLKSKVHANFVNFCHGREEVTAQKVDNWGSQKQQ